MRQKLIFGSLLAIASSANAQWSGTNPLTTSSAVGIGIPSPAHPLEVRASGLTGVRISQAMSASAKAVCLYLDNSLNSPYGGKNWLLYSSGPDDAVGAGNFSIYDWNGSADRFFIKGSTGNIGIGTINPAAKVHSVGGDVGFRGDVTNVTCTGLAGNALGTNNTSGTACGVRAESWGAQHNFGGWFSTMGNNTVPGVLSYAVYASVTSANANDYAGVFDGNVNFNGQVIGSQFSWTSDRKLKKEIKSLTNGLDKIKLLKPSTYLFRTDEFKTLNLPKENQLGLIAQELEEVFPELVSEVADRNQYDKDGKVIGAVAGHKVVNYIGLIPVLIAGVQEQQGQIESQQKTIAQQTQINADLQKQLDEQKELINSMKNSTATGINAAGNVETGFQMSQNEPNPFTHETIVKYTLPQSVNTAFMAVYDLTGKQITTFPIQQKGASSLTITSEKLSAGIYIYSIVADGKVVDSKRMIVADK